MPSAVKPGPRAVIVEANETAGQCWDSPSALRCLAAAREMLKPGIEVSYWPAYAWTNNEDDAIYTARSYRFTTRLGARATFVFTGGPTGTRIYSMF